MNARAALQEIIDAQQSYDAIEYGLRSIKTCGGAFHCVGPHAGQLTVALYEAGRLLGRGGPIPRDNGIKVLLQAAKVKAAARLKAAKAARKAFGGVRQLRLAIAADEGRAEEQRDELVAWAA